MIGVLGFDSRRGLGIFLFTAVFRMALGLTQPPIQRVPGALSLGIMRPGRETDHSPPSSVEVKNAWNYTSTPQYVAWCLVKPSDNFTLLDGGEWSASRPGRFTPREEVPDSHWIRGRVDPRAGLVTVVKRKIPSPCWDSILWSSNRD
jgi:hypothetical protein